MIKQGLKYFLISLSLSNNEALCCGELYKHISNGHNKHPDLENLFEDHMKNGSKWESNTGRAV